MDSRLGRVLRFMLYVLRSPENERVSERIVGVAPSEFGAQECLNMKCLRIKTVFGKCPGRLLPA